MPLTRAFREQLPQAALCIRESLSVTMQESLLSGRLDIALLYGSVGSPDIESEPLLEEELFLVRKAGTAARPPVTLGELAVTPLVVPSRPNAIRMLIETTLAGAGLHPTVAFEIDGVAAILDLVADGAGAAMLSGNAVANSVQRQQLEASPIVPPLRARLSLAVSAARPATLTQQTVLALIRQVASANVQPR